MTKHWTFRVALLIAFSFLLGFSYDYHLPKLEAFLLIEVEKLTEKHSPIRVLADKLHFHLFPLGVVLEDVKLLPKAPVDNIMAPARLKSAGAKLAIFPLLRGEFRLSQLFVRDSEINLFIRDEMLKKTGDEPASPRKIDFDLIYSLPIDELLLERVQLQAKIEPQNVVVRLSNLNLMIENRFRSLYVDLQAPSVLLKPSGPVSPLDIQVEIRTLIEAKEMQISALKLKANDAFFVASGRFNGDFANGKIDNGAINARTKLNFSDFNTWEKIFNTGKPKFPDLHGRGEFDVGLELRNGEPFKVDGEIKTEGLKIDKFYVGEVNGRISSDLKSLKTELITVKNDSGVIKLKNASLSTQPHPSFTATAITEKVQLDKFLTHIDVKNVPVELPVDGEAVCHGEWLEKTKEIKCKAKISSSRLFVHSGKPKKAAIVDAHDLRAEGDVRINLNQVEYEGVLLVGKTSRSTSKGVINYDKGFKIEYDAPQVLFSDLKNLADLKFEGELALKGSTEGTSEWATIDMDVNGKELWMEDYPLGSLSGKMLYKKGHLIFPQMQGQYQVTRFNGDLDVDLINNRLSVKAQIPFADLKDIHSMFQRKYQLPVEATGTGQGTIEASGPFNFRLMSYTMRSNFFRGALANETYDQLSFNVKSVDGLVTSENIRLTKANGTVEMKGQITKEGVIDSVVVARSLRLEQSENVVALGFDVQGLADVTMLLRGQLPKPHIELNGRFSRVVLADQPAEDSIFKLSFHPDRLEGSGQFLGTKVFGDFVIPYDEKAPFLFRMKAKKWDFTTLFSVVSRSAKQLDFDTSVSMNVNLQSPRGGLWAATGQVQVDEFTIRKAASVMSADKPMYLTMREGVVNSSNFVVSSGDSYLKLDVANLSRDNLNASLNGKMDLSLLGLFTPFISDLRGNMAISVDLRGGITAPKISGSAYLDRGYAKFVDFIHPFSNVRADVLFNDNQILVNSVRSDFASGRVSGDGRITFAGGNRTVDVKGTFSDVKINVPENFRTNGSGSVAIRGSQFPYIMDINYTVTGGEITYEIGEDVTGGASVKASAYLPRFLYQEAFHPFTFIVDVDLKNPVNVNNSQVQAQVNGRIKGTGTPDRLSLTGTINPLPGGKVYFRYQPFEINSAFIEYNGNPPQSPRIYLAASTRVGESVQDSQSRTAEHQYDVNMLVQGRGPKPDIILSSQPPLSQREIVTLLALGITATDLDKKTSSDTQAANTSTALGTALLQSAGGKKFKETFGLDVKVSTSQTTQETASTPKVTLSKQWTPKFGASASHTVQNNPTKNVKVEYKMNKNVSAVGSWENKESVQDTKNSTQNIFGLDLEYKVNFK